ncbi:MAG TPA: FAD-dependent oxidoreductase [Acetobacteraceae bacterium]|jgi:2-polyprenyl-6-methoxyphenol hydroxylase-like FAD-dependent oxidoreductase|nr:FAD-dependent oxidoreductase [Acetobacteraceae bacterium]
MQRLRSRVLVVGGGPVGTTLAMDLAWRGVDVLVLEQRRRDEPPSVKCNHVAARSMEVFRRLGAVQAVRDAGLPHDFPNDISFRTTFVGPEFARIPIPCRRDRYSATEGPDTWWPTPEPPHRINQIFLEPVLVDHAMTMPGLRFRHRVKVLGFTQSEDRVVTEAEDLDTGERLLIDSEYLIGCDGGHSEIRRLIGARLTGDAVVQRTQSTYFRAPSLLGMMQARPAWSNQSMNPRRSANIFAIDGRETWLLHCYLRPDEPDFESVDRDQCLRWVVGAGADFQYDVISKEDWYGRRLIADKFRDRRVFLCGDAAHIWVPFAGYGMNAGTADAMNLSWMLAGVLHGWADAAILNAHEAERWPITEQVSHYAMNTSVAMARARADIPEMIEAPGPDGDAVRATFGRLMCDINVPQFCCGGLNFGYFYERSPIVAYDGEAAPPYTMYDFTSSTVPGCRVPHVWLRDGRSLYDALGPWFTVLRFDRSVPVTPLAEAAAQRGVPLTVLDVDAEGADALYPHKLLLARPDQHVAWRGDAVPDNPLALVDRVRGAPA